VELFMEQAAEALVRGWPFEPLPRSLHRLRFLPSHMLDQMAVMA
jgi:hypothetical protein